MDKKLFKSLILLITYAIVLVAIIVKIDTVLNWVDAVMAAFQPIFIGFAIAFILNRPCNFFARVYAEHLPEKARKAARPAAVITSYLVFLAAITILLTFIIPELGNSIRTFVGNLSTYGANLQELLDYVVDRFDLEMLESLNLGTIFNDSINKVLSGALNLLTNTLPQLISMTSVVVSAVVTGFLSIVFSIYMLFSGPKLVSQCRRIVTAYLPQRISSPLLSVARLTADTFTRYISGQLIEACILGVLCFLGMCIFKFDYALLISVVIGVCALVPIAGAYMGAVIAAVLLVMIEPIQAVLFLVFLVILQQLEGNLIYPRVVGSSLGLPGIWVLAAVTVGSSLFGFVGLIASVPITAVVYTLVKRDVAQRSAGKEQNKESK